MENAQYEDFWRFIRLLHNNDLLKHVMVIGSWAEYLYVQSGIMPGFFANIRTLDIDFLIKNIRRPSKPVSIVSLSKEAGYMIDQDILEGTTKIYTPGLMEIEFLIEQMGSGENSSIDTNLGVKAQALRHISVLKAHSMAIELFDNLITVPLPESYVAHKIIINKDRGSKADKDRISIFELLPHIDMLKFQWICNELTKKEQSTIKEFIKLFGEGL